MIPSFIDILAYGLTTLGTMCGEKMILCERRTSVDEGAQCSDWLEDVLVYISIDTEKLARWKNISPLLTPCVRILSSFGKMFDPLVSHHLPSSPSKN